MSLHDVDKGNINRGTPTPNRHDVVDAGSIKAHQTLSSTYKTDASAANVHMRFIHNGILWYDDQNRIIRADAFIPSLAAYPVTIIAKYGYDVYTDILGLPRP
jgi:hypothetical protein